jgi:hypothetical protein
VYSVDIDSEVDEQISALPEAALPSLAELMVLLEIAPWSGNAYNRKRPDANMRTQTFGTDHEGLVIYLVIEDQRRVSVVRVIWGS